MWQKPSDKARGRFKSRYIEREPDQCWNWTGALFQKTNYGQFFYDNKTVLAHRFAFLLKDPKFDQEQFVLHTCDNRWCVNPNHLYLGDHDKNMEDMTDRDRQAKGESNGDSVLKDEDVRDIFDLQSKGHSQRAIARLVGISQATVWNVLNKKNWTHVDLKSTGTEVASN